MRTLTSNEVSTVSGGALIVGKNLGLTLGTGSQNSVANSLLGGTSATLSTDKLLFLGRSSGCGCACTTPS